MVGCRENMVMKRMMICCKTEVAKVVERTTIRCTVGCSWSRASRTDLNMSLDGLVSIPRRV